MMNHPLQCLEDPSPQVHCDRHGWQPEVADNCSLCLWERAQYRNAQDLVTAVMRDCAETPKSIKSQRNPAISRYLWTALACLVLGLIVMGAAIFAAHFPLIAAVWTILIIIAWAIVAGGTRGDRIRD